MAQSHSKPSIIVASIQQRCLPDQTQNLQTSEHWLEQAAKAGAELAMLQELHSTPYFCQTETLDHFALAEKLDGPTCKRLSAHAKKFKLVVVGSIFEERAVGIYHNTAVVFDKDGSMAGYYRKMHIPDDPGFYEKFYFTPGDSDGFRPIETSIGRLGVLVCWDQWYPEAARLMALAGAEMLLYPTAIGWDESDDDDEQNRQLTAWQTIQRSHAVANHLPVVVANRVGHETDPSGSSSGIHFWGNSFICGPQGNLLASTPNPPASTTISAQQPHYEGIITAEIRRADMQKLRQIWPYFRDRRIDAYQELTQRYRDQ